MKILKRKLAKIKLYKRKLLPFVFGAMIVLIPLFILSITRNEKVLADSLMSFDEGYGGSTYDANANVTGTINNAVWKTEDMCVTGKCLFFDGTGDYINYGDDADLDFAGSDNFTIEGWFRTGDITSGQRTLVAKYSTGGGYKVYMDANGYLIFGIDNDNAGFPSDSASTSTKTFDDNKWHHFAAVKSGTSNITIYVDNKQYETDSSITGATLVNNDNYYIGIDGDGSSSGWIGFLDEIKVYRSARTSIQIATDYVGETKSRGSAASFGSNNRSLSEGLVGYWRMEESSWNGTSGEVIDASGNGNNATAVGNSTTSGTAKYGRAGTFDGTGDRISVAASTSLNPTSEITLAAWVKTSGTSRADLFQRWYGNSPFPGYGLNIEPGGTGCSTHGVIGLWVGDGTNSYLCSTSTINDNTWHFVLGTYDGTTAKIYIDGKLDIAAPRTGDLNNPGFPLSIAADGGNFDNLNGQMDEARIYNRALSVKEVSDLYNFAPGPVGWWKMDENTGTSAKDSSGNNLSTTAFTGNTTWKQGKSGSGLYSDGNSDSAYIDDGTNSPLDLTGNLSLSFWINISQLGSGGIIISKGDTGENQNNNYACWLRTGNYRFSCTVGNGVTWSTVDTEGLLTPTINTWYHVAFTADGTYERIFINGVLINTASQAGIAPTANNAALTFLGQSDGVYSLNATLDDAHIYNYARTQKQIIEDMNGGHPAGGSPIGSELIYWNMDEGNGTTLHNSIASQPSLTSTISGDTVFSTDESVCKVGGCVTTGLTTDYINGGDISALDGASNLTFTFWYGYLPNNPMAIISKWNNSNQDNFLVAIESGEIRVYIAAADTQTNSTSPYFVTSGFNSDCPYFCHIAIVYDGTQANADRVKVYEDGKRLSGSVYSTIPTATTATTSNFKLNASDDVTTYVGTLCAFDEFKVYTSSLTQDEVLVDKNAGSSASMGGVLNLGAHDYEGFSGNAPVAWWKMDEGTWNTNCSTSTVMDSAGSNHNGKSCPNGVGPTSSSNGRIGKAVNFDGVDDYFQIPDSPYLEGFSAMSICAWVNERSTPGGGNVRTIAAKAITNKSSPYQIWGLFTYLSDNIYFTISDGDGGTRSTLTTTNSISLNKWQHVCGTYDGTTMRVYIDGKQDPTTTNRTTTLGSNSMDVFIGAWGDQNIASYDSLWDGKIDDVKLYDYARSQAQIAYDYNRGAPVAQYDMDECTGANIHNSSVNGNKEQISALNGTLNLGGSGQTTTGDCTTNANTPWYNGRVGKYTSSVNFDGTNDYISIPRSTIIEPAQITYSAWVYTSTNTSQETVLNKTYNNDGSAPYSSYATIISRSSDKKAECFLGSSILDFTTSIDSVSDVPINTWTNITCTYNGSVGKIYINGKLENSVNWVRTLYYDTTSTGNLFIGSDTATSGYFAGQIDGVLIYNYPLTDDQVKRLYNEGSAVRFGQ